MNGEDVTAERSSTTPSQSLIIPAYNEAPRILQTIQVAWSYLQEQPYDAELLIVDDGSSDSTASVAQDYALRHPGIRVLTIPHGGKAAAVRAGMIAATGDFIAFSDADLATPLSYLDPFRAAMIAGDDVVIGSREGIGATRIDEPIYRHVMGRVFNLIVRVLVLPGLQDTQCGFKMFRRAAAEAVLAKAQLYRDANTQIQGPRVTAFDVELLVIARRQGFQIRPIPVAWTYGTQSKVNPVRDTLSNLSDVLLVKWNDLRGRYR